MDDTTKDKLATNASNAFKMASNWVMGAAGLMFAVYLSLPVDQQQALVNHLPVEPWLIPIATSTIGILARLWPQKSISPTVAAAKSDAPEGTP